MHLNKSLDVPWVRAGYLRHTLSQSSDFFGVFRTKRQLGNGGNFCWYRDRINQMALGTSASTSESHFGLVMSLWPLAGNAGVCA